MVTRLRWQVDRVIAVLLLLLLAFIGLRFIADPSDAAPGSRPAHAVTVPAEPPRAGEYRFGNTTGDGTPIGWNPCTPIPYWIGNKNLPRGGTDLITWALAEITNISGQQFDFRGYTDTVPSNIGDNPVKGAWIGWTTETTTKTWVGHELQGSDPAIGMTSRSYAPGGYTTAGWSMLLASYNPRADAAAGGVLRHELGHLLGLAHVDSDSEVMSPGGPTLKWGPGDRRGLWDLGPKRRCS